VRFFKLFCILQLLVVASVIARADDWEKDYAVTGTPELRLDTKDGDVELSTWDQNKIHVHVSTIGYRIGPSDVRIEESQTGNDVAVSLRVPSHTCFFCHLSLRVTVQLPRQANLNIHTGDGNVTGADVHGDMRIRTGDGNVTLDRFGGRLDAETGDGNIHVDGGFNGFSIHTGDGNVEATADESSKITDTWSIGTGDGNVKLWVPSSFSADVELRTGDGKIKLDLPITVSGSLSTSHVSGKLNQGGPPLEVRTGDGNIELGKR
jgi:DUF4097 and DUF4098 domain-containing protein YvlB